MLWARLGRTGNVYLLAPTEMRRSFRLSSLGLIFDGRLLSRKGRPEFVFAAQTYNYTYEPLADMPADFGPEVPDEGVSGLLVVRSPDPESSRAKEPWQR